MKYLSRFNESKEENKPYNVVITWENGSSSNSLEQIRYPFSNEDDVIDFLNFMYELMNFNTHIGYEGNGSFVDGHYERLPEFINKVDQKYGNKYSLLIPKDRKYKSYRPKVNALHVEENGLILSIVWGKALKLAKKLNIPAIGEKFELTTGQINGHTLGIEMFGGSEDNYYDYEEFAYRDIDMPENEYGSKTQYSKITKAVVTDCIVGIYPPYDHQHHEYDRRTDTEKLIGNTRTYFNYTSFRYVILLRYAGRYIVTTKHGYDPNFESKFHRPKFGTNDYFFVP